MMSPIHALLTRAHTSLVAIQAAMNKAVEPAVRKYMDSLQAEKAAVSISSLRSKAEGLAETEEELRWIRKQLHEPTVSLRQGTHVDSCELLDMLQTEIHRIRAPHLS